MGSAAFVIQGFARLGESHTADTRWSTDLVALAFDVHDSAFHDLTGQSISSEEHGCEFLRVLLRVCWPLSRGFFLIEELIRHYVVMGQSAKLQGVPISDAHRNTDLVAASTDTSPQILGRTSFLK